MFCVSAPSKDQIRRFISEQKGAQFLSPIVANNFNDFSDLPMFDHDGGPVGLVVVV